MTLGADSDTFNSSLLDANANSRTSDPGSVAFYDQFAAHNDKGWTEESSFLVHPSLYMSFMEEAFKEVRLQLPVLVSPYFFGEKMQQGVQMAIGLILMRFNDTVQGRLLAYKELEHDSKSGAFAACIPELKGKVPVPIRATFLVFAPPIHSTICIEITRLSEFRGIGHVLKQATVRFDARGFLGRFMRYTNGEWRYGEMEERVLTVGSIVTATVASVGQEDDFGLIMSIEVVPTDATMMVFNEDVAEQLKAQFDPLDSAYDAPRRKKRVKRAIPNVDVEVEEKPEPVETEKKEKKKKKKKGE